MVINFALTSNGATYSANDNVSGYSLAGAFDGLRHTNNNYSQNLGYQSQPGMSASNPKIVEVALAQTINLSAVVVCSLADAVNYSNVNVDVDTFNNYGLRAYKIEYWNGAGWSLIANVTGNNKVGRSFAATAATNRVRLVMTDSPDSYARLIEFEVWGSLPTIGLGSVSSGYGASANISGRDLISRANLEFLTIPHLSEAADQQIMPALLDYSGNNRHAIADAAPGAALFKNHLAGKSVAFWDGVNNQAYRTPAPMVLKHLFVVASVNEPSFSAFRGLVSDTNPATAGILNGTAGTTLFEDKSPSFAVNYRKNDLRHSNNDQAAPVNAGFPNRYAVIEMQFPHGLPVSGLQIGQDRSLAERKWFGGLALLAAYSEIKNECERRAIYEFCALNFWLWRQRVDAQNIVRNIFPFAFSRDTDHSETEAVEISEAEGGRGRDTIFNYLADEPTHSWNNKFTNRSQDECSARRTFLRQHRLHIPFYLEDQERGLTRLQTWNGKVDDSGTSAYRFNYSFGTNDY